MIYKTRKKNFYKTLSIRLQHLYLLILNLDIITPQMTYYLDDMNRGIICTNSNTLRQPYLCIVPFCRGAPLYKVWAAIFWGQVILHTLILLCSIIQSFAFTFFWYFVYNQSLLKVVLINNVLLDIVQLLSLFSRLQRLYWFKNISLLVFSLDICFDILFSQLYSNISEGIFKLRAQNICRRNKFLNILIKIIMNEV